MLLIWVLIVLERAKSSILANGNFREFFLWRGGNFVFQNGNSRWPWTGAGWPKLSGKKGVAPSHHSSSQKTRLNGLSHGVKIWTFSSVLSQCTRLRDGQRDGRRTDRQTDINLIARPCSEVKIGYLSVLDNPIVNSYFCNLYYSNTLLIRLLDGIPVIEKSNSLEWADVQINILCAVLWNGLVCCYRYC